MYHNVFYPSRIFNDICEVLDSYIEGIELFGSEAISAIQNYFTDVLNDYEFIMYTNDWPDEEGGSCSIAWVEDNHPQLLVFDYRY